VAFDPRGCTILERKDDDIVVVYVFLSIKVLFTLSNCV
jgi:hypothetical protein